jgi:hypothetical protein
VGGGEGGGGSNKKRELHTRWIGDFPSIGRDWANQSTLCMGYPDTGQTSRISEPRNIEHYHIQAVSGYRIHQQDI